MNKNVTMAQLFKRFDESCDKISAIEFIADAMKRTVTSMESVTFVSDDNTIVVGETYYIQSSGIYKIQGKGTGEFGFTIKEPNNLKTLYEGNYTNNDVVEELYLTHGDICYIHASQVTGTGEYTVTIQQVQTLYEYMATHLAELERGYKVTDSRVELLIQQYDSILWEDDRTYEPFSYVRDSVGTTYVSLQAVPVGTELTNTKYWIDLHSYIVELAFIHDTFEQMRHDIEEAGKGSISVVDEDFGEDEEWIEETTEETEIVEESEE
jgi:hypothetical protein